MKRLQWTRLFALAACLLLAGGCSTKKNTFFTRNFHNLTAYYNVYWNGLQSQLEADNLLKNQSVDNYFNVLPVFKYGNPADTAMISQQTARMIEKALRAIKKHSISIRGKEYVKTIDNAYLLMGQGFFYQQQYSKARSVFNFILSEFAANPERYEAMLWIARTYIREEEYSMASSFISQVEAQSPSNLMKQTVRDLPLVQAEYLIRQEKYKDAVPYLQKGLQLSKDRDLKARIYFILGQLEQRFENNMQAYAYYKECLKLNPPLDLVFNARLNMALCFDGKNINQRDIMKGLEKMLRDPKNQAYFGRIYYVMGEMAFRQGNEADAVAFMDMSIAASQDDPARTLLAAKRLSAYFYANKQYIESQKYYEIAAKVVEYDDPDYYTIVSRAKNLADLTVYYQQFTQADTLKLVGKMSKREQKQYAERKAKEYRAQQEAARLAREQNQMGDPSTPGRSNWYFYNEQTKNAGLAEFNRRWGRRELEDLWFLSSKPAAAALRPPGREGEDEEEAVEEPKILTQADPEYYLNQLPTTDSAYQRLDSLIEPALYHVGMIYCDRLSENAEGERYLARLVSEYPQSIFVPSACETLCKIYRQEGDMASFGKYAGILSERYPGTEQDERVNNPDYYRDLEANAGKVEELYEKAYDMFVRNDFQGALEIVLQVEADYPINNFREQFLYLKTMATAHVSGYEDMLPLAGNFVNSYPESALLERVQAASKRAEQDLAKNILFPDSDPVLAVLPEPVPADTSAAPGGGAQGQATASADTLPKQVPIVEYRQPKSAEKHSVVMVFRYQDRDPEVMLLRVEGFNDKFYDGLDLEMEIIPVSTDPGLYMLAVSSFPALRGASGYLKMIRNNDYVFGTIEEKVLFEINGENLELLKQSGDPSQYSSFYQETYQ